MTYGAYSSRSWDTAAGVSEPLPPINLLEVTGHFLPGLRASRALFSRTFSSITAPCPKLRDANQIRSKSCVGLDQEFVKPRGQSAIMRPPVRLEDEKVGK